MQDSEKRGSGYPRHVLYITGAYYVVQGTQWPGRPVTNTNYCKPLCGPCESKPKASRQPMPDWPLREATKPSSSRRRGSSGRKPFHCSFCTHSCENQSTAMKYENANYAHSEGNLVLRSSQIRMPAWRPIVLRLRGFTYAVPARVVLTVIYCSFLPCPF